MKTGFEIRLRVLFIVSVLSLCPSRQVVAQTLNIVHSFSPGGAEIDLDVVNFTNSDGMQPAAGLILSGNTLYGTAPYGGIAGEGTVFKVNVDGSGFSTLHNFTGASDGLRPMAALIVSSNMLYGTADGGGGNGIVFRLGTDGTGFTTLHSFPDRASSDSDGAFPSLAEMILVGNTLYGTTFLGGSNGLGTVFAIANDGSAFTLLHSFTGAYDGASPHAGLIYSRNKLYGTTQYGGSSGVGTVFAINTNGTFFTNLHSFNGGTDGANPVTGLVLSGNTLYGACGTVFKLNTDGTGFMTLVEFPVGPNRLVLSGNALYGSAQGGGTSGEGTIFAVNTDGTAFTTLYSFTGGNDGAIPEAGLVLGGQTLFGTAAYGGSARWGTVFSLSFTPQLIITPSAGNVILSWPTNYAGFDYTGYIVQSATNLASPVWTTNLPAPIIVNGQYTVTNPISGAQQFFRLSQ